MATAVLDLDIARIDDPAEAAEAADDRCRGRDIPVAPQYDRALIVVRRHRVPVGQFWVPVRGGYVDSTACRLAVDDLVANRGARWAVEDYLGPPPMRAALPSAAVAICTRERPDDLQTALRAIIALHPAPAETLVVDNNPSTVRTMEVTAGFPGVRYVREDRPGLDAARNRALREATADVVAFTDDDAAPEPGWLGHLLQPFDDPRVLCTTGLTLPRELETPAQEWFERYSPFGRGFVRRVFDGIHDDPLSVSRVGAGANMALRRSVVRRVGEFDEALDGGTPARSGGDHEMFGRILASGFRIVYEPRAVSWHRHRRTWEELRDTLHGYGVGVYAMWTRRLLIDHEPGVVRHACGWLLRGQLPTLWRALTRRRDSVPLDLVLAEMRGCVAGPRAYLASRRIRGAAR